SGCTDAPVADVKVVFPSFVDSFSGVCSPCCRSVPSMYSLQSISFSPDAGAAEADAAGGPHFFLRCSICPQPSMKSRANAPLNRKRSMYRKIPRRSRKRETGNMTLYDFFGVFE